MNIFLVPYTWVRHIVVGLNVAGAALLAWWAVLYLVVVGGPVLYTWGFLWTQALEGAAYLGGVAGAIGFTSVLCEGSLRRRAMHWRLLYAGIAGLVAALFAILGWGIVLAMTPYLGGSGMRSVLEDNSLVSLRYRMLMWVFAGMASGWGPFVARMLQLTVARFGFGTDGNDIPDRPNWNKVFVQYAYHVGGGGVAASLGAMVWHMLGYYPALQGDLYVAAAMGPLVWGLLHGLLVWPIPDDLYAGWVRVLSAERYGLRIPIDRIDEMPSERFVGHYPRGLDMYLPVEHGVAELHTSFVVDEELNYAVRGLSQQPTMVKRSLESIDLHYDERRPAPLETSLKMEDRVIMGIDGGVSELEFLLLPKEEM